MDDFELMLKSEIPEPTFVQVELAQPEPEPEPEPEQVAVAPRPKREPKPEDHDKTPIYLKRGDNGTLYNQDAEDMEIKFRSDFSEAIVKALRGTIERRNRVRYLQEKLNLK